MTKRTEEQMGWTLAELLVVWRRVPHLRLAQLIGNMAPPDSDTYHVEDDDLVAMLRAAHGEGR